MHGGTAGVGSNGEIGVPTPVEGKGTRVAVSTGVFVGWAVTMGIWVLEIEGPDVGILTMGLRVGVGVQVSVGV